MQEPHLSPAEPFAACLVHGDEEDRVAYRAAALRQQGVASRIAFVRHGRQCSVRLIVDANVDANSETSR